MSSKAALLIRNFTRPSLGVGIAALWLASPAALGAQDDGAVTDEEDAAEAEDDGASARPDGPINILITVPRGEVNEAQARECEERADAGSISGEIIVCRQIAEDPANSFSGSREDAQRRYAEETAFAGDPRTPNTFGIPNHGNAIGFGSVPPPALIIDVEALPEAPEGSDADRIARGLPPLGEEELTEEEIRKRREALGLPPPKFGNSE